MSRMPRIAQELSEDEDAGLHAAHRLTPGKEDFNATTIGQEISAPILPGVVMAAAVTSWLFED